MQNSNTADSKISILIIDDERAILRSFAFYFEDLGYRVLEAGNGREGLDIFERERPQIVFTDLRMPVMDGFEFLRLARELRPETPIIVVSGTGIISDAIRAVKLGAWDYITKPLLDMGELEVVAKRAIETLELRQEVVTLRERILNVKLNNEAAFRPIITNDEKMTRIFHYIEAVASTNQPILITGQTGTGKELMAHAVHDVSGRKGKFVAVNVGGVDDTVFSDTLFGHVKGAFTGADRHREGMIKQAANGTLFLDEIGELSNASQVKLLRLIQEQEYFALGSDNSLTTNARIITATNLDLRDMAGSGKFRKDLYYRLCAHHVNIPSLKARTGDIRILLEFFVDEASKALKRKTPDISAELCQYLAVYDFPGNIRELKSMVYDGVAQHSRGTLSKECFLHSMKSNASLSMPGHSSASLVFMPEAADDRLPTLKEAEEELIKKAMERAGGNQGVAARYLGITRQGLNKILNRYKSRPDNT